MIDLSINFIGTVRKLSITLCVWSALIWFAGCGNKPKAAVARPSQPALESPAAVQQSEPAQLQGEPAVAVLMEIDEEVITTADVLTALAKPLEELAHNAPAGQFRPQAEQLIGQYLRQQTAEILLLNEAKTSLSEEQNKRIEAQVEAHKEQLLRDCEKSPTLLQKKLREKGTTLEKELDNFKRDLQVRIFLSKQFASRINISRQDIVAYYNQHSQQYNTAKKVELLKIQVLGDKHSEAGQTPEQAQAQARQIAQQAWEELAAGTPFAEVARKYSDTRQNEGGNWGLVDPLSLEEDSERQAAQTLQAGQYSKVLDTEMGCSIIGVAKIIPAQQKSMEEVQEQIQQSLWNQEYKRLYDQRIAELGQRAVITVSPTAMRLVVDLAQRRFATTP